MKFSIRTILLFALISVIAKAEEGQESFLESLPKMPMDATTLVCGDDEELFQIQILVDEGHRNWASYRVITESTNEVHGECIDCMVEYPGAHVTLCLPRNGCHTALVGRANDRWNSCIQDLKDELIVSWGEQTLRQNNAWLFDRIDFGDGCANDPVCDTDDEVLFEYFRDRGFASASDVEAISFSLTDLMNDNDQIALLEGQINEQDSSVFTYESICVPRSSCLEFTILPTPTPEEGGYYIDFTPYSVRLDGVIYGENAVTRWGVGYGPGEIIKTRILLGNNCTVETACNATGEDLFAMEFEFYAPDDSCNVFESTSAIATGISSDPIFILKEDNEEVYSSHIRDRVFSTGIEVNQPYASKLCIPNDECAKFSWKTENPTTYYKLFQNGEELTQRIVHTDEDDNDYPFTTTGAGTCAGAGKLSLVQWIAVSSTLSMLALFAALL